MFPKVQFVLTTHSPLFVLGMNRVFGEDGFALYRLPHGYQISPEDFNEFGNAYRAFTETSRFSKDMRTTIERAQKPIVFVDGTTGQQYLKKASQLLGQEAMIEGVEVRNGGGSGDLKNVWNNFKSPLPDIVPRKVVLLFDCDEQVDPSNKGNLFRRTIPLQPNTPIQRGIENLISKATLEKARQHKLAFIDVDPGRTITVRGELRPVPDQWTINKDKKTNLCDWLCENGTQEDFQGFRVIFELLNQLLDLHSDQSGRVEVTEHANSESLPDGGGVANLEESQ